MDRIIIPEFTHLPIKIETHWVSKIVTIDPPKYIPHNEYKLIFEMFSEALLLPVLFFWLENSLLYNRSWRNRAQQNMVVELSFVPNDWKNSDSIRVGLWRNQTREVGGVQTDITSTKLKADPRKCVEYNPENLKEITTGDIFKLASINCERHVLAYLLMIAKCDTQSTHGRWKIKKNLVPFLPNYLEFLKIGKISGNVIINQEN